MALGNLKKETGGTPASERLDPVIAEVERVARLLNDYLSLAKHTPEPPRLTNVRDLVGDLLTLLQYQTAPTVQFESDIPDDLECNFPRDRVRQALLNLIINAAQAMESRKGAIVVSAKRDDSELVLNVCDDGPGFPPPLLAGQPPATFTTSREAGTGLGLAMVRRTVRDLGGSLQLTNRTPHGGAVCLRLPCPHA